VQGSICGGVGVRAGVFVVVLVAKVLQCPQLHRGKQKTRPEPKGEKELRSQMEIRGYKFQHKEML